MGEADLLVRRFEAYRPHLRAVAYRMLGSLGDAEDAVQEAWLRLSRSDPDQIDNLGGWLTTVVGRVCLTHLRTRATRREVSLEQRLPDPVVSPEHGTDPEQQALLADSVGLAMLVVLDTLRPAERFAFVLHDMFSVPYRVIAEVAECTPAAARQMASRARRRVRDAAPEPDPDPRRQREVVDAFLAAARDGDFEALVAVLHPEVVLRFDTGDPRTGGRAGQVRGVAEAVRQASAYARLAPLAVPVLVNGVAGLSVARDGQPIAVLGFTVRGGRIVEIFVITDRTRLQRL